MSRLIEPLKSILTATLSTKLNPKLKTNPNTISVATCFFCAAVAISILCTLGCEGPKAAPKAKKPLNLLGNLDPDNNQTNLPKKRIAIQYQRLERTPSQAERFFLNSQILLRLKLSNLIYIDLDTTQRRLTANGEKNLERPLFLLKRLGSCQT